MQRRTRRRSGVVLWALLGMLLLSSCKVDWGTWGFDNARQGYNPWEQTVSPANVSQLQQQWATEIPTPAGLTNPTPPGPAYINASPIVATNIDIGGTATDVAYVGNEEGGFSAVSTAGQVLWSRNLGRNISNCPDTPDMEYGVSASAVVDRAHNRVYVVGGDGYVYALNPATGATLTGWPVQLTTDPTHEFVYSAPTQNGTNLYVAISARCDLVPYHGRLIRIDTETHATNAFYVTGSATGPSGGSIWGWGGASVDPRNGDVYIATGNTIDDPQNAVYGESVIRLTSDLQLVSFSKPGFTLADDDFGSTPTLFQKSGCPAQLATQQKNGNLFLYDRDNLANGPRQTIRTSTLSINVPAYSPANNTLYVVNAKANGPYVAGLLAFKIDDNCNLSLAWQTAATLRLGSTPTVANGVVYYTGGYTDKVYALNADTGALLWSSGTEIGGHPMPTPVMVNGQLFVSAYDGKLHAYGLPASPTIRRTRARCSSAMLECARERVRDVRQRGSSPAIRVETTAASRIAGASRIEPGLPAVDERGPNAATESSSPDCGVAVAHDALVELVQDPLGDVGLRPRAAG